MYRTFRQTEARDRARARYCHECGRTLAGPLAERVHSCDDRPTTNRWTDRARGGTLTARVEYIA
jgi:ribosomal protein L34E